MSKMNKPLGFESALSEFKACDQNLASGEPTAWGFEIIGKLSEEQLARLKEFGELQYSCGRWYLVTHHLTREEAEQKYGAVTLEIHCVDQSICSVRFGDTPFVSTTLCDWS
jgi:hypothetical protein